MRIDTSRASDALYAIPADLSREEWIKAGMGFKAAGGDFETFNNWSSQAGCYKVNECSNTWKSFKAGKVGPGSLFHMARDYGFSLGNKRSAATVTEIPKKQAPTKPVEQPRKHAPGMSAADIWQRCKAATYQHGYIARKKAEGVPLEYLRVVPDGDALNIAGQSVAGFLVVPGYAPDGELQSAQFIPPGSGKKLNLPGASMAGASFTVGPTDGTAHLCEGIGAAWAVWQSTGLRAVACFGCGNMRRVAESMRQRDPAVRLVICPDTGKEADAQKIAVDVGAAVAAMPPGWENNSDVHDLFQREGFDVLAALLESATEPPKPELKTHPLARYVALDGTAKPPRWVIPGLIGQGVVVIAGAHGVGKTTALLPLAMTAAGLHGDDLMPLQWRHVCYVTEDVEQAKRILAGIVLHSNLGISLDQVRERIHIVEAVRLDPETVASVGATYRQQFARDVQGVKVLPLVVLDTKSAVLAIENENDNSEASAMMAALKQGFDGLPVWLIGHVAKANLSRNDALTSRGATAIEGDANQTMFLIREGERRYLVQGKTRFEAKWHEIEITSYTAQTTSADEFGNLETVLLRWGIAAPAHKSRKEAAQQTAEQQRKENETSLRQDILSAVHEACLAGNPLNREGIKIKSKRKHSEAIACLETLVDERWIHEVLVPSKERLHPRKSSFFVSLTTQERDAFLSGSGLPYNKGVVPASWKKIVPST